MLAQNIASKPAALPPAAQPSLPANSAGGPSFAQFLTDQTAPPAPPPETDAQPSQPDDPAAPEQAAPAATAAPHRATAPAAKTAGQNQNRATEGAPKADAKVDAKAAPAGTTDAQAAADAIAAGDEEPAETPQLKEFTQLIGMQAAAPDTTAATVRPDTPRSRTAATGEDAPQGRVAPNAVTADNSRAAEPRDAAAAKPGELRADKSSARASTESLQVTTRQTGSEPSGAAAPAPAPTAPSFSAVLAQAMPTPTAPPDAASATTYANVQAPLHGPAFAPEMGARVSLMAVDGVQHAELQLNPADMGPVTVQIVVDGSQAQVSFHALQAETRQALEQSLPDLAAALQGQGLTLSGGGVFQQAQRDAGQADDKSETSGTARGSRDGNDRIGSSAAASAATGSMTRRSVGLLDTFA